LRFVLLAARPSKEGRIVTQKGHRLPGGDGDWQGIKDMLDELFKVAE
jgi:hypothetical protein